MKQRHNGLARTALLLGLTAGIAAGAEDAKRYSGVSHRVVTIDREVIRPSALTIRKDDVLEFVNYSTVPMMLAFIEPQDHSDKASCHVVGLKSARKVAPEVFQGGSAQQPTEIIPPGGFVSVCSLARGQYVFTAKEVGMDASVPMEKLGSKGTVTVE